MNTRNCATMQKSLLLLLLLIGLFVFSNAFLHETAVWYRGHKQLLSWPRQPPPFTTTYSFSKRRRRRQQQQRSSRLVLSSLTTTTPQSSSDNNDHLPPSSSKTNDNRKSKLRKIVIISWTHLISIFVLVNYFFQTTTCWPAWLTQLPSRNAWTFVHAVSGMVFSGTILTTTVMEWIVVQCRISSVLKFWFQKVEFFETILVLPALTLSIVSGVAQAFYDYGHLRMAPKHVKGSLHLLFLFGLWWGFTDRTTQRKARVAVEEQLEEGDNHTKEVPDVLFQRRWSNVVSCIFVLALYAVMALKPWYNP